MARKYLIPFLSVVICAALAFALQAHSPSWRDFLAWFGLLGLITGALELLTGLFLLLTPRKVAAKEFLITGLVMILVGAGACSAMSNTNF